LVADPHPLFQDYFNLADELDDPRSKIDDFDKAFVKRAEKGADMFDLPWPPRLAAAEEFLFGRD